MSDSFSVRNTELLQTHLSLEEARSRQQAEEGVKIGLTLIEDLNHTLITKAVDKVRRAVPDLFYYFDIAKKIVNECKALGIDEDSLKAYCVPWQWGKAARKAKKSGRKKAAQEQEQFCLDIAEGLYSCPEKFCPLI